MIDHRSHSEHRVGWMSAMLFNAFLFLIPFIAANIMITGYTGVPYHGPATAEILADTGRDIDRAFENLPRNDATARTEWAALISQKLEERNMSAARGFLLAAPQMLSATDQRSIRVAAEADPSGNEDERLMRAALLFVPSDIRVNYETSLRPRGVDLINIEETEPSTEPVEIAAASLVTANATASLASMTHTPAFSVLGTVEDLVSRSRSWMRGNRQRAFEMRLTGIAMASPPSTTGLESEDLIKAASILKTAWRSGRLHPSYERVLSQRLASALPDETLTANLEVALSDVAILTVRAQRVQDAFAKSIDPLVTARLGSEFQQIAQIADATGPRGAISLLEHAQSPADVSRARLLAEAGGHRAVALASQLGPKALEIAGETSIKWNRASVINTMLLATMFIVLLLSWAKATVQAFHGGRKDVIV